MVSTNRRAVRLKSARPSAIRGASSSHVNLVASRRDAHDLHDPLLVHPGGHRLRRDRGGGAAGDPPRRLRLARRALLACRPARAPICRLCLSGVRSARLADRLGLGAPRRDRAARHRRLDRRALCRPGFLLLLVPPLQPPLPPAVGEPCGASLDQRAEPVRGVPLWLDRAAHWCERVLPAADMARLRPARRVRHAEPEPALSVLYPRHLDTEARAARMGAQHAVAPPRAPRRQPGIPRQEFRRRADRLRPAVRHLRRRARRRAVPLRPRRAAAFL